MKKQSFEFLTKNKKASTAYGTSFQVAWMKFLAHIDIYLQS